MENFYRLIASLQNSQCSIFHIFYHKNIFLVFFQLYVQSLIFLGHSVDVRLPLFFHLQASLKKLLTYYVLRSTQRPTHSGMGYE